jgi:hypothetical protein
MSEGSNIRVRCISEDKPWENAVNVSPNLEDAYLWLLRKKEIAVQDNPLNTKTGINEKQDII